MHYFLLALVNHWHPSCQYFEVDVALMFTIEAILDVDIASMFTIKAILIVDVASMFTIKAILDVDVASMLVNFAKH